MAFGVFRLWPSGGRKRKGPLPPRFGYWDGLRNGRVSDTERWRITPLLYFSTLTLDSIMMRPTKGMNFVCHDQSMGFRGVPRKRCLSGKDGASVDDRVGAGN